MVFVLLMAFSCNTKKNIQYFKNIEDVAIKESIRANTSTIQPGDMLGIVVLAKDNEVAKPFNQNYYSTDMSQYSSVPSRSASVEPIYIVDSKGNIDFPILGSINTTSLNVDQLREILKDKLSKYIKNPGVNLRTVNYKVTVLGEVNRTGTFTIDSGQPTTILNVLGLAGDLTIYGERKNVLVIRNVDGVTTKEYIDLTSADLFNSPYYYVKQNDVIYVTPNKARQSASSFGPEIGVIISVVSVLVGVLALVFR